jgi:hypothetical protein
VTIQATRSNHCGAWPLGVETECSGRLRLPLAVPLPWSFLKQLEYCWPYVVFRVEPWEWLIRVKRGLPYKTSVMLQLHAEQGEIQTGEIIVVDAAVHKRRWKSNLANVLLDCKLGRPHGQRSQVVAKDGVVRHARVNVVLYPGPLCSVG